MKKSFISFLTILILSVSIFLSFGSDSVLASESFFVASGTTPNNLSYNYDVSISNYSDIAHPLFFYYTPISWEYAIAFLSDTQITSLPSCIITYSDSEGRNITYSLSLYNSYYLDDGRFLYVFYDRNVIEYGTSFNGLMINSTIGSFDFKSNISLLESSSMSPSSGSISYNTELGYLMNIKNDSSSVTFTNGGKDWTNVISYDEFTSTGMDMLADHMKVQYIFEFNGNYGNAFGFGNTTHKMTTYYSDTFEATGLSFTYDSTLWKDMYLDWIEQNNLSATERVKNAHLTIWLRPASQFHYGDWVKLTEDGNSYLITSSQPFEGTDTPQDATTSIGSSSNVSNSQNGNEIIGTYDQISTGDIDVSQLTGAVRIFVDGGQAFIGLFRTYFSWLPDWVVAFVGLSVTIWAIMIVKRAILG